MPIKTILACLTTQAGADAVMTAASALARRHDAHLIGLHTIEALMVYPGVAMHIPDTIYEEYGLSQIRLAKALAEIFEKHTHAEEFVSEWRTIRNENVTSADRIVESASSADLVILATIEAEADRTTHLKMLETVIRDSGRPVLIVPATSHPDPVGQSVMLGWNGTREAVRAAHDTLTLLQDGDTAHILHVNDSSYGDDHHASANDLAAAFARHGIKATVVQKSWSRPGVAAALNQEAFEKGADMIAIGAFGHSRTYDFVIGAATRDLLRNSTLPVLYSR